MCFSQELHRLIRTAPCISALQRDPCKCNSELIIPAIIRLLGFLCVSSFARQSFSLLFLKSFPRRYTCISISCLSLFTKDPFHTTVNRAGLLRCAFFLHQNFNVTGRNTRCVIPPPAPPKRQREMISIDLASLPLHPDVSLTGTLGLCLSIFLSRTLCSEIQHRSG